MNSPRMSLIDAFVSDTMVKRCVVQQLLEYLKPEVALLFVDFFPFQQPRVILINVTENTHKDLGARRELKMPWRALGGRR